MGLENALNLQIIIEGIDRFTGPLRSMESSIEGVTAKFKGINDTMRMMGKSKSEIDGINASLQRMADQKAFANVANDLEKIGMAKGDIAAMEQSYMRMAQYQRDMAKAQADYAAGKDLAMSGVGNVATGALGAFGIFELVKKAGEFQSNMAVIQDSTGATTKQMQGFGDAVMNASANVSKFNDMQMGQIAQTLSSGGFGNIKDVQSLLLPTAKYAEVQMYEHKSSDPIEATKRAIEMAHVFGNYKPKQFEGFLNDFNKYSMMQPGDSSQLAQTLTYLAPTANTMKMKQSDVMALAAIDNVIGLTGSHGGTNSADMILRLIPGLVGGGPKFKVDKKTGKVTEKDPKAWLAMKDLGFIDSKGNSNFFNKDGSIKDLNGMLGTMIADAKGKNPKDLMKDYSAIFGVQGGRAAALLSNPRSLEQLGKMREQLGKTKSMDDINKDLQATPEGQLNLLKSNSMTLMLRVGQQLAISLNPAIAQVNKLLGKMLEFSQAHPQVAKLIGDFALFAVGGKIAEGVLKIFVGNFKMLGAAVRIFSLKNAAGEMTLFGKVASGLGSVFKVFSFSNIGKGIASMTKGLAGGIGSIMGFTKKMSIGLIEGFANLPHFIGGALIDAGAAIKRFGVIALEFAMGLPGKFVSMGTKLFAAMKFAFSWEGIVAGVTRAASLIRIAFTFMMGPWGILIAAVIAGVALLITHWSQVTSWVNQHFGQGLPNTLNMLKDTFQTVWNAIVNAVMQAWNYIEPTIVQGIQTVQKWWNSIWPELSQVLDATWKIMLAILAPAIALIGTYIVAGIGFIKGAWTNGWMAIGDVLKIAWDLIKGVVQIAWYAISGIISVGLDVLTLNWSKAWDDIKSTFSNIWDSITGMFGSLIQDAWDFGSNFVKSISDGITGAIGSVVKAAQNVWNAAKAALHGGGGGNTVTVDGVDLNAIQHAKGGIFNTPHFGLVAEAGPEAIIPLSNPSRGIALWQQAGAMLGVFNSGGAALPSGSSGGGNITINVYANGNITRNEHELGQIVSRAILNQTKLQGRI